MLRVLPLIAKDRTLRMIALAMVLIGCINSAVMPYQSLIAIQRIGISDGAYAVILFAASACAVLAAVGTGIVTDQRANRRQLALWAACGMMAGPALMVALPGAPAFILYHALVLPVSSSLFGQCFTLARLACLRLPAPLRVGVLSTLRATLSLTFVIVLPLLSVAFRAGLNLMAIYVVAMIAGAGLLASVWRNWPRDGQTRWRDPPSGLSLTQSLREISRPPILGRIALLGCITSGAALYMVLIGLVFDAASGRDASDVALFVGLVAGCEVPFMLALPALARGASKTALIAMGAAVYGAYLVLLPVLAPTWAVWLLPVVAGLGGATILTLPIVYLQDKMADRPGAGASLMALQKVMSDSVCAVVFAAGSYASGYGLAAAFGGAAVLAGGLGLLAADRRTTR